jgi:hypothetical protein
MTRSTTESPVDQLKFERTRTLGTSTREKSAWAMFTCTISAVPTTRQLGPLLCGLERLSIRRGARVVDWARLEIWCTACRTVGSNPTLSAKHVWPRGVSQLLGSRWDSKGTAMLRRSRYAGVANVTESAFLSKGLAMYCNNRQSAAGGTSANPTLGAK